MRLQLVAMITVSALGPARGQGTPADRPGRLLTAYLYQRQVITHEHPVVLLCGPQALANITSELRAEVIGRQHLADSILVAPVCSASPARVIGRNHPVVRILSVAVHADTSRLEAFAEPFSEGQPPYAHGRRERFQMVEGQRQPDGSYRPAQPSLLLFEFDPAD